MKKYFKILLVVFAVCFCVVSVNADSGFDKDVKKLDSLFKNNNVVINYNDDLNKELIDSYIEYYLINNKIFNGFIEEKKYNDDFTVIEFNYVGFDNESKHYDLNVIHNRIIDNSIFSYFDITDEISVFAEVPENNLGSYLDHYLNLLSLYKTVNEVDYKIYNSFNEEKNELYLFATDSSKNNIQALNVNFNFVGYDNNVSEIFNREMGMGKTLYFDNYEDYQNFGRLFDGFEILGWNINEDGYADVAYSHYDGSIEIHKVKFNLDINYTDKFSNIFNLYNGDKITVYSDDSFLDYFGFYFDKDINLYENININCSMTDGFCYYIYHNYDNNSYVEVRRIPFEIVESDISSEFLNRVGVSKDVYLGYSNWERVESAFVGNDKSVSCEESSSSCLVAMLTDDYNIEVRNVKINLKEGKSPLAQSFFPDNTLRINSIYTNDNRDDDVLTLMSETISVYLNEITNYQVGLYEVIGNEAIVQLGPETLKLKVEYKPSDAYIFNKVKKINDRIVTELKNDKYIIHADDLEFINLFYYDLIDSHGHFETTSFNNKLSKIINDPHVNYYYLLYGGDKGKYTQCIGGNLILYYNGIGYKLLDEVIHRQLNNIIYIPNETEDSIESYVEAAQKRIDDYLGENSGVVISYNGKFDNKALEGLYTNSLDDINIDESTFDGNEYIISYGGRKAYILIYKDSNRMKTSTFIANDVTNNIVISSDTSNYPANTIVKSNIYNKGSEKYVELLDQLEFDDGYVIDLSLYSKNLGTIDKFDGGKFKVKLSLDGFKYYGLDLYAFYIDEEGNVEKYKVTMDGDYATFEPTHFSTYVIADINGKVGEEPPIEELSLTTKSYYNKIRLEYNEIKDATKYVIYTCNSKGASCKKLATTTSTIYDHKSLGIGKTYYYKVLAYDGSIKIMTSDLVKGSTTLGKPVLIATTDRYKEVKLSWGSISGASRYYVYRCNSKGSDCTKLGYTTKTSYTYTGGSEGYKYIYKVRAYRSGYYGPTSDGVEGMKLKDGISFSLTKPTYRTIQISINHLSTAKKYYIYRATSKNGKYSKIATLDATGETIVYKDTSVSFNKKYYYKIIASNGINNTAATSYKYIVSNALYKPVVTASNNRYQNTIINWNKIAGATKYYVYRCNSAGSKCEKIASTTKTSYTYTGGSEGVTYQYKVKPYVGSVAGPTSAGVDGIKLKDGISYSLSSDSYRSIVISINHLSTAKKYYIYRATSKNGKYSLVTSIDATGEKIIYNDTGLTFNKKYYYKIKVSNGVNTSAYSSIKYYTAASLAKPNVEVNVSDKKVTLNMPKVYGSTGVEIYYSTDGKTYKLLKRTTSTSYTRDLAVGKHYFKVRAYKSYSSKYYYSSYTTLETIEIVDTPEVTPSV